MNWKSTLVLCTALMASPAWAQDVGSANFKMPGCRNYVMGNNSEEFAQGYCLGTVATLMSFSRVLGFCVPSEATSNQGVRVVVQYIDSHPERLNEYFLPLATEALLAAWPCH